MYLALIVDGPAPLLPTYVGSVTWTEPEPLSSNRSARYSTGVSPGTGGPGMFAPQTQPSQSMYFSRIARRLSGLAISWRAITSGSLPMSLSRSCRAVSGSSWASAL